MELRNVCPKFNQDANEFPLCRRMNRFKCDQTHGCVFVKVSSRSIPRMRFLTFFVVGGISNIGNRIISITNMGIDDPFFSGP